MQGWTIALIGFALATPGAIWASIQIYRNFKPGSEFPQLLTRIHAEDDDDDAGRELVQLDMARAFKPGTLENAITSILKVVPSDQQMLMLAFPEIIRERAQRSSERWSGAGYLLITIAVMFFLVPPLVLFFFVSAPSGMSIEATTAQKVAIIGVPLLLFLPPAVVMLLWGRKAKRIQRAAERFLDLQEETGIQLGLEWTQPRELRPF